MFVIYAHRGASEYYPENTFSSFYAGIDMGANGIETDIWKTKDGVLILWHDDDLSNKTSFKGSVPDYTYDELMTLEIVNKKYGRKDKIVRFEDFLRYFGWRDLTFAIEIKQSGIASDIVDMLDRFDMKEKTFITSFKFEELEETYAYTKDYRLGYLYSESTPTDEKLIERLISINAYQACPKATTITKESLELIHSNGLECRAWGIANTDIMKHAVDIGVDGGMTVNFPDKLVEYLAEKGKTSERI